MNKIRDFLSRPVVTVALFALALVLLGESALGGARASLTIESQDYNSQIRTSNISVALVENGNMVEEDGTLLEDLLVRNKKDDLDVALKTGKHYTETLQVENTGAIEAYVRVTVYKYWIEMKDNKPVKVPDMDSKWIKLGFDESKGWKVDPKAHTEERDVLYYSPILASGERSDPFLTYVYIDNEAGKQVSQTLENGVIRTTYLFNDKYFCLEVHVDGVQTHSADMAKLSAWGDYLK